MKEIKPTYTTYKQARLLKEKGFSERVRNYYTSSDILFPSMDKADFNKCNYYSAPEQWQVIEWLRVNHKLHLLLDYSHDHNKYSCKVFDQFHADELRKRNPRSEGRFPYPYKSNCLRHYYNYNTPQEATSAAIDYVLEKLI